MLDKRKFRIVAFICVIVAVLTVTTLAIAEERKHCMDVPLIKEDALIAYAQTDAFDISTITYNGDPVAADYNSKTIYISQPAEKLLHCSQLEGILETNDPSYTLYFLQDTAIDDISSSVRNNTPLTLILADGLAFQKISVVITTLPVIRMDGAPSHINEEGREVLSGRIALWTGNDSHNGHSSIQQSAVQWHMRGQTSTLLPKVSWKLSLKDANGENNHLNFLNLGADDDWILNAMATDDTKIREKLFINLWNTKGTSDQPQMAKGEYVEVVINGQYMGLYLLQRRIDAKYLQLSERDVLLKGTHYQATCATEAYELKTSNENIEEIYAWMQRVYDGTDCSGCDLLNVIDTNLFLQLAGAMDNYSKRNIYHVMKYTNHGYKHYFLLWDTDMSFGLKWIDSFGVGYNYKSSLESMPVRIETGGVCKAYPMYDEYAAARWFELRETLFAEDNLLSDVDALVEQLTQSGVLHRDKAMWGERHGGIDTVTMIKQYIVEKLQIVDAFYTK